jgi:hypothetical protein
MKSAQVHASERVSEEVIAALDARLRLRYPAVRLRLEDLHALGARRTLLGGRELRDLARALFLRRLHAKHDNTKTREGETLFRG